jgi:signal transduction histidine kinase
MTSSTHSPVVNIPLQGLPFAAAALDRNRVIVAANHSFQRLCADADADCSGQRLEDLVAGRDRQAVAEALDVLALEDRAPDACSIKALRAKPPSLWLAINLARLGPESPVPYLACLQAIPGRRQNDGPPRPRTQVRAERSRPTGPDLTPSSVERPLQLRSPALMTFAHECRGPLLAIRGWAQLAERAVGTHETVSRALAVIGRNASSLSHMIEDLFDLSRRTTGSLALNRERIDLNPLAQLVVESTLPAARDRDVTLSVRRAPRTLPVNGDALRLEQVLRNLVDNAIKFTPTGGQVRVTTRCDGSFAELVVTDNGPGISPDLLPGIFEPFRHDDDAVAPSARGLGLGLAIVRELVQLHEGDVRALSGGTGHGSTFVVRLPLANSAVAACA